MDLVAGALGEEQECIVQLEKGGSVHHDFLSTMHVEDFQDLVIVLQVVNVFHQP